MQNPNPRGFIDQPPMIPAALTGDARSVRSAWGKLVTKGWKAGQWNGILDSLELVPAKRDPGNICLESWKGVPHSSEVMGRVYLIPELLKVRAWTAKKLSKIEAMDRLDKLLLEGMKHFWFAAGLLQSGNGSFYLSGWPRTRNERDLSFAYLSKFVDWLPEFDTWDPYRFDTLEHMGGYKSDGLWVGTIGGLACNLGCSVDVPNFRSRHGAIISAALIASGIIASTPTGYVLTPPSLEQLVARTYSTSPYERHAAVTALGEYGIEAKSMRPRLVELLSDSQEFVRNSAKYALSQLAEFPDPYLGHPC